MTASKVQELCSMLRTETLEPAQKEAQAIVERANAQAKQVVDDAKKQAQHMLVETQKRIEQEKRVFETSLRQAAKQVLAELKSACVESLFEPSVGKAIAGASSQPQLIASIVTALYSAVQKNGRDAQLELELPKSVDTKAVLEHLAADIRERLSSSVLLSNIQGGAKLRLKDQRVTLDLSDATLTELLSAYVRKDFRKWLFAHEGAV